MRDDRDRVRAFDHRIGLRQQLGEGLFDFFLLLLILVAFRQALDACGDLLGDLVGQPLGNRAARADIAAPGNHGSAGGHRLPFGDDVGQYLVFDLDGPDRVAGLLLALGGDGRDEFTLVAKGRARIGRDEGRLDPRHLLGGRDVQ